MLIASQIVRDELGFDFPQEVDFKAVYASWFRARCVKSDAERALWFFVVEHRALDFVEIERKVEGVLDAYTGRVNPNFAHVAEAIGFRG